MADHMNWWQQLTNHRHLGGEWRMAAATFPHVLNRPGQVQYHTNTEHCHLSQPAQKRDGFDETFIGSMVSFAWICTAWVFKSWKQTSKTNQRPMSTAWCPQLHKMTAETMYASRSTLSAHTAVEMHKTTCTISTLIPLEPMCASASTAATGCGPSPY